MTQILPNDLAICDCKTDNYKEENCIWCAAIQSLTKHVKFANKIDRIEYLLDRGVQFDTNLELVKMLAIIADNLETISNKLDKVCESIGYHADVTCSQMMKNE